MKHMILLVFMIAPIAAHADSYPPSSFCRKPLKPFQFNNQWEIDSFNDEVRRYKGCITDFVEEQEDAIRNHQEAAEDAIDEWNSFVNFELN